MMDGGSAYQLGLQEHWGGGIVTRPEGTIHGWKKLFFPLGGVQFLTLTE